MVYLKDKDRTNIDVVARVYDTSKATTKNGKTVQWAGFAVHPDDPRFDGSPWLIQEQRKEKVIGEDGKPVLGKDGRPTYKPLIKDGKPVYTNEEPLYENQIKQLVEAAGDNKTPLLSKEGKEIGTLYGVQVDAPVYYKGKGNVPSLSLKDGHVPFRPSTLPVGEDTLDRVFTESKAIRDANPRVAAAPEAEAPVAEAEASVAEASAEEVAEAPAPEESAPDFA